MSPNGVVAVASLVEVRHRDIAVAGHPSELGISEITVKAHRGKVMRKMKADSLADLVTLAARRHTVSVRGF